MRRKWTAGEIKMLVDAYAEVHNDLVDLKMLAERMGRTVQSVYKKAYTLGLRSSFFWSDEEKRFIAENYLSMPYKQIAARLGRCEDGIRQYVHKYLPPGRQFWSDEEMNAVKKAYEASDGGKVYLKSLAEQSGKSVNAVGQKAMKMGLADQDRRVNIALQRLKTGADGVKSRGHAGKRGDLGFYVRSSWEANYARYLKWLIEKGEIQKFEYEPETFWFEKIKRGNRTYTPDFKVWNKKGEIEYHEVKGWMDDDSRVKLERMARYYPQVKIVLIDKGVYRQISKWARLIPNWEEGIYDAKGD